MNVYKSLNEITAHIDANLDSKIDTEVLARMLGVNTYTMERLFSLLTGYTMNEYIRKRRLSDAGLDLYNEKCFVMDVAIKYGYNSATAFSRAFEAFHGIKPSKIEDLDDLKIFPRITFDENIKVTNTIEYEVVELDEMKLWGIGFKTDNENIGREAPIFFRKIENENFEKYGPIKYGIVTYEDKEREYTNGYYVLYDKEIQGYETIETPGGKYLAFIIDSQEPTEIQEMSNKFYYEFLPTCKYILRDTPEIEYYHDGITDFYVPII